MSLTSVIFVFGLTIDIMGAYYLAQGFITKDLDSLVFEGTSGYGSPPNLRYIRSALLQKAEAWIGFSCLTFGFALQMVDYLAAEDFKGCVLPRSIVLLGVIIVVSVVRLAGGIARKRLFERYGKNMAQVIFAQDQFNESSWRVSVAEYLLPKMVREGAETDDAFADRILKEIGTSRDNAA